MVSRLGIMYRDVILEKMKQCFGYSNVMQVPRLKKITINMGVGEAASDKKIMTCALDDLSKISGQKPIITLSPISKFLSGIYLNNGHCLHKRPFPALHP